MDLFVAGFLLLSLAITVYAFTRGFGRSAGPKPPAERAPEPGTRSGSRPE